MALITLDVMEGITRRHMIMIALVLLSATLVLIAAIGALPALESQ